MNKTLLVIGFLLLSIVPDVNSAEGGPCKDYGDCDQFKPDLNNMASLQRGVGTFMKYCYSCHSLKYSRWGRVANDLQIPEDIFFEYLVPDQDAGPYDLMVAPIHELEIDNAPPDLTLVARKRTSSWVYAYLRAFYDDSSTTYGSNNLVYPGVNMPNILAPIQGNQKLGCKEVPVLAKNGGEKRDEFGNTITKEKCGYLKHQDGSGLLNVEEFDEFIYDLTNFLTYVGEPSRAERERMGVYAIIFFIIFTFLSALLYREYQKDYH